MNLIKIGNSKLPPGSKNIANDGIVLQISITQAQHAVADKYDYYTMHMQIRHARYF